MAHSITPTNPSITPEHSIPSISSPAEQLAVGRLSRLFSSALPGSLTPPTRTSFSAIPAPSGHPLEQRVFVSNPIFEDDFNTEIINIPKEGYVDALPPTEEQIERMPEVIEQIAKDRIFFAGASGRPPMPLPRREASRLPLASNGGYEFIPGDEHTYQAISDFESAYQVPVPLGHGEPVQISTTPPPPSVIQHPSPKQSPAKRKIDDLPESEETPLQVQGYVSSLHSENSRFIPQAPLVEPVRGTVRRKLDIDTPATLHLGVAAAQTLFGGSEG